MNYRKLQQQINLLKQQGKIPDSFSLNQEKHILENAVIEAFVGEKKTTHEMSARAKQIVGYCEGHLRELAERSIRAEAQFKFDIMDVFEFGFNEAEEIFNIYRSKSIRAIKYDYGVGKYQLSHGGYWDRAVMERALEWSRSKSRSKKQN